MWHPECEVQTFALTSKSSFQIDSSWAGTPSPRCTSSRTPLTRPATSEKVETDHCHTDYRTVYVGVLPVTGVLLYGDLPNLGLVCLELQLDQVSLHHADVGCPHVSPCRQPLLSVDVTSPRLSPGTQPSHSRYSPWWTYSSWPRHLQVFSVKQVLFTLSPASSFSHSGNAPTLRSELYHYIYISCK